MGETNRIVGDAELAFWSKVDKSGDCWLWTGSRMKQGYGYFRLAGKTVRTHRLAYAWANGPIPEGMQLDHICHVPACVRPEHLRLATNKQNTEHRQGAQANSKSGVRGVTWHIRRNGWQANLSHHGKKIHVGYFDSIQEAEAAVIAKRNELFTHNDGDR